MFYRIQCLWYYLIYKALYLDRFFLEISKNCICQMFLTYIKEIQNCSCLIEITIKNIRAQERQTFQNIYNNTKFDFVCFNPPYYWGAGGHNVPPLLGDRQYLPDEKARGYISLLLFISTYLTHSGQISWLYYYNF